MQALCGLYAGSMWAPCRFYAGEDSISSHHRDLTDATVVKHFQKFSIFFTSVDFLM